jgi:nitrogenase molybdenum-iron protein alpha/beta subunit
MTWYSLKKIRKLLATEYIKSDNNEGLRNVENFLKLLQENYGTTINKAAEETVMQNKRHSNFELPVWRIYRNYMTI